MRSQSLKNGMATSSDVSVGGSQAFIADFMTTNKQAILGVFAWNLTHFRSSGLGGYSFNWSAEATGVCVCVCVCVWNLAQEEGGPSKVVM